MSFVELSAVLGNVGEFLGSIAVLVTLIYLAVQVRHSRDLLEENRKIALSQVFQERARDWFALNNIAIQHPEIYETLRKEPSEVSSEEQGQLLAMGGMIGGHLNNMLYQGELGLLSDETLGELEILVPVLKQLDRRYDQMVPNLPERVRNWLQQRNVGRYAQDGSS